MRLENKVALITGGGSGIGAAAARLFAREGAKIVVTGRRPEPIAAVAAEVGGVAVAGDTSDPAHVAQAVAAAVSAFGGIDVLVASAGGDSKVPWVTSTMSTGGERSTRTSTDP